MDMSKYGKPANNDLKALEYKGKKFKVTISGVSARTYPANDTQEEDTKAILTFDEFGDKTLVVSHPNCDELREWWGDDGTKWIGKELGLSTKTWNVGEGWVFTRFDAEPKEFDDDIPF